MKPNGNSGGVPVGLPQTSITENNIERAYVYDDGYQKSRIENFKQINVQTLVDLGAACMGKKRRRTNHSIKPHGKSGIKKAA